MKNNECGPQQLDIGEAAARGKAEKSNELTGLFNFSFDHEYVPLNSYP